MALKKSNYYVKSLGMTLPQAVALITTCKSDRENGTATIGVFASRENALNKDIQPFETVTVNFKVDRNENDRATAYHTAKTPKSYVNIGLGHYSKKLIVALSSRICQKVGHRIFSYCACGQGVMSQFSSLLDLGTWKRA